MLHCDGLNLKLQYTLDKIDLSRLVSLDAVRVSGQERVQLAELGQVAPLTVIQNAAGTYTILAGEDTFAAMAELHSRNAKQFRRVDAMVIRPVEHEDTVRNLLLEYRALELGCGNQDAHRFRIIDLLRELADLGALDPGAMLPVMTELFGQSARYARMYLTIAASGTQELREAVMTPSSGKREKSAHIPVQLAAQIAKLPPEMQRAEVTRHQSTPAATPSAAAPKRNAVEAWLQALQSQVDSGMALDEADTRLLAEASQLYKQAQGD